jgi:peptide/nickel transport system permease protein
MPGSYADLMTFQGADPESIEQFREKWGMNDPLYIQYFQYIYNIINLELGVSLQFRVPVIEYVKMKIFNSIILVAPGITAAYVIGSFIGSIAGTKRGSFFEKYVIVPFIFTGTFPAFFIGIVLIVIFSGWLDIFPAGGMLPEIRPEYKNWWEPYLSRSFAMHYVLPFTAIILRYTYLPLLIMRTNVVETMGQDFIQFHRLTGLTKWSRLRHVMKHASLPVLTLYPVSMTRAIGGLVLIEIVFNWPGIGFALVQAVFNRDLPVLQFVFILVAIFIVFANFIIDIMYSFIDPRIQIEK